jgi:hypothetical protein
LTGSPRDFTIAGSILAGAALVAWSVHRDARTIAGALELASEAAHPGVSSSVGRASALPLPAPLPGIIAAPDRPQQGLSPDLLEQDAQIRHNEVAQNLILTQRPAYAKACWSPTVSLGRGESPLLHLTIEFDAQGNEMRRAVENAMPPPLRTPQDDVVLKCVTSDAVPKLRLDPPGKPVTVRVNLSFP